MSEIDEAQKIEDGKLKDILSDYKEKLTVKTSEVEKLKAENDQFHSMLDKKIDSNLDKLTDQQKEFMEGLDYFKKQAYIDQVIGGNIANVDPDKKKPPSTNMEAEHSELLKKYSETGDKRYFIQATELERKIIASRTK